MRSAEREVIKDSREREARGLRLVVGDIVDGRYSVSRYFAEGGLSIVYEGRELVTGEPVALKIARSSATPEVARRFVREAHVLERVRSIHLPTLVGYGYLSDGAPYLALKLLEGCTLERKIRARVDVTLAASVELTRQLLRALHAIHCEQIVHCDVKPANLFVHKRPSGDRVLKLIDFSICMLGGQRKPPLGEGFPGTPPFMSPEQLNGRTLDARTDLYSAGVVLYGMLAGRLPFDEKSVAETADAVLHASVCSPRLLRPECPQELARFVMKAISRKADYRFTSALAMLDALDSVASSVGLRRDQAALAELAPCRADGAVLEARRSVPALARVSHHRTSS